MEVFQFNEPLRIQRRRRKTNGRRVTEGVTEISLTDSSVAWHCRRLRQPEKRKHTLYISGHDYLDVERASCLMNTPLEHCVMQWAVIGRFPSLPLQRGLTACRTCAAIQHAVAVPVPRFQVWGSNPSQDHFFGFFSFSQLSATVTQWRIFFENFID